MLSNVLSAAEEFKIGEGLLVVVLGILIVFLLLVLLVFIISGFKSAEAKLDGVLNAARKAKSLKAAESPAAAELPGAEPYLQLEGAAAPALIEAGEQERVTAVITAAIAAILGQTQAKNYKSKFIVRDIRKIN
jgi:sodium pump decarboxylase gamma subunit